MLTFFEYLRKRAFESIVVGVQNALECLEKEPFNTQSSTPANQPGQVASLNLELPATEKENGGEKQLATGLTGADPLPPPRRRGRPPKSDRPS